jgi:hypothetical protein
MMTQLRADRGDSVRHTTTITTVIQFIVGRRTLRRLLLLAWAAALFGAAGVTAPGRVNAYQGSQPLALSSPVAAGRLLHETTASAGGSIALVITGTTQNCAPVPGESYDVQPVGPPPMNTPPASNPDLNLGLRGYRPVGADLGLVDYTGDSDSKAPQLAGLFSDGRTPAFSAAFQVSDWDWSRSSRGDALTDPEVTLVNVTVAPDEVLRVPDSGYTIGNGYEVLVLYASPERITLKYTSDDDVTEGYTLHLENVCLDPALVALYQSSDSAARGQLPALRPGQAFARARSIAVGVAIRDNGKFMDPRSRKDWWRGG